MKILEFLPSCAQHPLSVWWFMTGPGVVLAFVLSAARPSIGQAADEISPGIYRVGKIQNKSLRESSGLVLSRKHPGLFWTHNDQGNHPVLFGIDRNGNDIAQFHLSINMEDWEDLAIDNSGQLYLGDLGNNERLRKELKVYRIGEPDPTPSSGPISPDAHWTLRFPAEPFDCESLFVDGDKGYVISKVFDDAKGEVYSFDLTKPNEIQTMIPVATLPVTSPITGADLSADRNRLAVVCKAGGYVFAVMGEISKVGQARYHRDKFKRGQIEGCSFVPEGLLATEEGGEIYLFTNPAYSDGP